MNVTSPQDQMNLNTLLFVVPDDHSVKQMIYYETFLRSVTSSLGYRTWRYLVLCPTIIVHPRLDRDIHHDWERKASSKQIHRAGFVL